MAISKLEVPKAVKRYNNPEGKPNGEDDNNEDYNNNERGAALVEGVELRSRVEKGTGYVVYYYNNVTCSDPDSVTDGGLHSIHASKLIAA